MVWLLNRALRSVREDCCDDLLLADRVVGSDAYCSTLLHVAYDVQRAGRSHLVLSMSDGPHPLGRRFRRIMDTTLRRWQKLPISGLVGLIALAAVLLPGLHQASRVTGEPAAAAKDQAAQAAPAVAGKTAATSEFALTVVDANGNPVAGERSGPPSQAKRPRGWPRGSPRSPTLMARR